MPSPRLRPALHSPLLLLFPLLLLLSACNIGGGGGHHGGGGGGGGNNQFPTYQVTGTDSGGGAFTGSTQTTGGTFADGEQGATFTVTIANNGNLAVAAGSTVTVSFTFTPGLTAVSTSGSGWSCSTGGPCTRSDGLAVGQSWSAITITVNVAHGAASPETFTVTASGGAPSPGTALDNVAIKPPPALAASVTTNGNFASGATDATYVIHVQNTGQSPTYGTPVAVADPPVGLTITAMTGTNWTCTVTTGICTTTQTVAAGQFFTTLMVTGTVTASNGSTVSIPLSLSGGGSTGTVTVSPTPTVSVAAVALSITKSHTGNFVQGGTGTYSLVVSNGTGAGQTSGTVTVTEAPPTGLTVTAMSGTNWTCVLASFTCTRSDNLAGGASYPKITVTVSISSTAPASVTNTAGVSGGLQAIPASANDVTTINPQQPVLSISKTHTGNFTAGQTGATYTVTVSNTGSAATTGTVTVTEVPPTGLTVTGMSGTSWTCAVATFTCTRSDALAAGSGYPTITVTVNVAASASSPQVNMVTISGGGSVGGSANDSTIIAPIGQQTCPLSSRGNESVFSGIYSGIVDGWKDPKNGIQGPFAAAAGWHADSKGNIPSGEVDAGQVATNGTGATQSAPTMQTFTGCYNLGSDLRGSMIWNFAGGGSVTFSIAVVANGKSGLFIEFDDSNPSGNPGTRNAGHFELETPVTATNAPVAFGLLGYGTNGTGSDYRRSAAIGVISNITFGGAASNGTADIAFTNDGTGSQTNIDNQTFTATFSSYDSQGRGTAVISFANITGLGPLTLNFSYYLGDPGRFFLQSTDTPDNKGHSLENGRAVPQTLSTFSNTSVGTTVFQMTGADLTANHAFTDTAVGQFVNNTGVGTIQANLDEIRNAILIQDGTHGIPNGLINILPNGMGTINLGSCTCYSIASFSVAMYDTNAGFIMQGTQSAVPNPASILFGDFRPQTVPTGGFTDGTFSGLSIFGTLHPAYIDVSDVLGSITATTSATAPNPPSSFSGKEDFTGSSTCSTGCLLTDQTTSATYAVDANGRLTITVTSPGANSAIGWLRDNNAGQAGKDAVILSNISSTIGTIVNAFK